VPLATPDGSAKINLCLQAQQNISF